MPVPSHRIFLARWLDAAVDSSWMVVVFTAPVFLAYGVVFDAGSAYYARHAAGGGAARRRRLGAERRLW